MSHLSIILVNYNNSNDTINCILQLNNQFYKDFEVIIVDNDSDNDSIEKLNYFLRKFKQKRNFDLKIYYQGINNGFAGGMNYGIKKSSGEIIVILNSDIIFDDKFLENAIQFLDANPDFAIMGPKIYYYPNTQKIWFTGGYFRFFNYSGAYRIGRGVRDPENKLLNEILEVDYISGCCMFIRREIFKKIKLFDKNYFMYIEDSDFCYRAKISDLKVVYNPKIILYHKIDEKREKYSKFIRYHYFKNKFLFILKHYPVILIFYHTLISIFIIPISISKNSTINENVIKRYFKTIKSIIVGISLGLKIRIS